MTKRRWTERQRQAQARVSQREPSKVSLREIPEIPASAKTRPNPYATPVGQEGKTSVDLEEPERTRRAMKEAVMGALVDWMVDALQGKPVSDFAESFAAVRLAQETAAERDSLIVQRQTLMEEGDLAAKHLDAATREANALREALRPFIAPGYEPPSGVQVFTLHLTIHRDEYDRARDLLAREGEGR